MTKWSCSVTHATRRRNEVGGFSQRNGEVNRRSSRWEKDPEATGSNVVYF